MPKGLIPLMLSSPSPTATAGFGSRPSASSSKRASYSPPVSPAHRRNVSDVTPILKLSRPPIRSSLKRQSQQIPASLPSIPSTSAEWKRSIAEIKRYHVTRRFRACSARCNEILSNLRSTSVVEPAYLICVRFYAATSLEMCARPLAPASSYRINLLQQARAHYERAAALIRTAEEAASSQTRSSSSASSLPSLHSPSGSISSRAWTPDCGASTPTSTISRKSSLALSAHQDPRGSGRAPQKKKQVSFELPRDRTRWSFTLPEPVIRPDSPTLGFDDEYFAAGAMRQELPEVPISNTVGSGSGSKNKRASRHETVEMAAPLAATTTTSSSSPPPPMPSISESEELSAGETDDGGSGSSEEFPLFDVQGELLSDVEPVRSLARYCETLSSLKTQVASHMVALDEILEGDLCLQQQQQEGHHPPESPALHDISVSLRRLSLQSAGTAASYGRSRSGSSMSFASSCDSELDELRSKDRQARIDRLRMSGWKRKRFDASRYEQLCDVVMEELSQTQ